MSNLDLKLLPSKKHPLPCVPAAAFLTQTVCLDDTTVKFEIWDTAGQERYHSLAPMYYRGAQAAIVVYDITNEVSQVPVCVSRGCGCYQHQQHVVDDEEYSNPFYTIYTCLCFITLTGGGFWCL